MNDPANQLKNFTDLLVWKKGHQLVLQIYKLTKTFPKEEQFGLTNQMRRCAVSITSNIAEGFGRRGIKDKTNFYYISRGSLTELQNQLYIAKDNQYITQEDFQNCIEKSAEVLKLINSLIKSCNKYLNR